MRLTLYKLLVQVVSASCQVVGCVSLNNCARSCQARHRTMVLAHVLLPKAVNLFLVRILPLEEVVVSEMAIQCVVHCTQFVPLQVGYKLGALNDALDGPLVQDHLFQRQVLYCLN